MLQSGAGEPPPPEGFVLEKNLGMLDNPNSVVNKTASAMMQPWVDEGTIKGAVSGGIKSVLRYSMLQGEPLRAVADGAGMAAENLVRPMLSGLGVVQSLALLHPAGRLAMGTQIGGQVPQTVYRAATAKTPEEAIAANLETVALVSGGTGLLRGGMAKPARPIGKLTPEPTADAGPLWTSPEVAAAAERPLPVRQSMPIIGTEIPEGMSGAGLKGTPLPEPRPPVPAKGAGRLQRPKNAGVLYAPGPADLADLAKRLNKSVEDLSASEIAKETMRLTAMGRGVKEQDEVSAATKPVETGRVETRKTVESLEASLWVPERFKQQVKEDASRYYNVVGNQRTAEVVKAMRDVDLALVPKDAPIYTAARLENAKRLFNKNQDDAAYRELIHLSERGTEMGQQINLLKQIGGLKPQKLPYIISRALKDAGFDEPTAAVKDAIKNASIAEFKTRQKFNAAHDQFAKTKSDADFQAAVAAEEAHTKAQIEYQQKINDLTPKQLPDILKVVLQGNLLVPASQIANISGNLAFGPWRAMERTATAAIDAALLPEHRTATVRPIMGTKVALEAIAKSGPQMLQIAKAGSESAIKGEMRSNLHPLKAWKRILGKELYTRTKNGDVSLGDKVNTWVEATVGAAAEPMLRGLAMMDLPFRNAARARAIASEAKLAKIPDAELTKVLQFPEAYLSDAAMARVLGQADRATFQQKSHLINTANAYLEKKNPWLNLLATTFVPYKLTPWNIASEILSYNPAVALAKATIKAGKAVADRKDPAKARAAISDMETAIAKAGIGMTLTGAAMWLYNKGLVAPAYDTEDESIKVAINAKKVLAPNHLNLSGLRRALTPGDGDATLRPNDQTVDLFRGGGLLGAFVYMISNVGRRMEKTAAYEGDLWKNIAKDSIFESMRFAVNQSFLKGATGLLEALKDGRGDQVLKNWIQAAMSIPLPNTLEAISRASRKYKVDTKPELWHDDFTNSLKTRLGFAGLDNQMPLKRDYFGRPMAETPEGRNPWVFHLIDIGRGQSATYDPIDLEMYRLARSTGNTKVIPSIPERQITVDGKTYPLLNKGPFSQYDKYSEAVGAWRKELANIYIATNEDYHKADDAYRVRLLEKMWDKGHAIATKKFFAHYGNQLEKKPGKRGYKPAQQMPSPFVIQSNPPPPPPRQPLP